MCRSDPQIAVAVTRIDPTWLAGGSSAGGGYGETMGYDSVRTSDGWDLLLSGDLQAAHNAFDREALELPDDGLPQMRPGGNLRN